jgi:hypothetical protein
MKGSNASRCATQGMHRYVMAASALFLIMLASWGRSEAFDRISVCCRWRNDG